MQFAKRVVARAISHRHALIAAPHDRSMLLPTDLEIDLGGPSLAGTDGVVLWGAPDAFKTSATYV